MQRTRDDAAASGRGALPAESLTPREWEIAGLLARGHSNRKIAEELVIAGSTAERHVANILSKLNVRSRAEIAVWVVEQRLTRAPAGIRQEQAWWSPRDTPVGQTVHNLPAELSSFVGRGRELDDVKRLLLATRLVTLTGVGGVGKTRLALQVAAQLLEFFSGGVFLVSVAALTDAGLVVPEIAKTLGVREQSGGSLLASLTRVLIEKPVLLVLDNFEQVLPAAVSVSELLHACPKLKVLATSRAPLRIDGEQELLVPPLRLPVRPWPTPQQLSQYEAARLFIERARSVQPDFQSTQETAPAIAEICARLDGLPLAIELAAARIKLIPPQAMLARLDFRLGLLVGGPRDRAPRQQTLRATIDWSFNLLGAEHQAVFRRLGAFTGGCTLEAAEAVCAATHGFAEVGPRSESVVDMLEVLGALVDQSLIYQQQSGDGRTRFHMLDTIREYALERLMAVGEADAAHRAHVDYFIAVAKQAAPELIAGPQHAHWLDLLEPEENNLQAALRWCLDVGEIERGLQLGGSSWEYWWMQGSLSQSREWLSALLKLLGSPAPAALRAQALDGAGALSNQQGDYLAARALHEDGLAIARDLDDKNLIASVLHHLSLVAVSSADFPRAFALVDEAVAIRRAAGDRRGLSGDLKVLGGLLTHQGDYVSARARYAESVEACRELGDKTGMSDALSRQGFAALAEGDVIAAQTLCEKALLLSREDGNRGAIAWSLLNLALVRLTLRDYAATRDLCLESILLRDDTDEAQARLALAIELIASTVAVAGEPVWALRLFGAAEALPAWRGTRFGLFDRILRDGWLAIAAQAVGECSAATAMSEGRALTPGQTTEYLFEHTGSV